MERRARTFFCLSCVTVTLVTIFLVLEVVTFCYIFTPHATLKGPYKFNHGSMVSSANSLRVHWYNKSRNVRTNSRIHSNQIISLTQ